MVYLLYNTLFGIHGQQEMVEAVLAIGVGHAEPKAASNIHGPFFKATEEETAHHTADKEAGG